MLRLVAIARLGRFVLSSSLVWAWFAIDSDLDLFELGSIVEGKIREREEIGNKEETGNSVRIEFIRYLNEAYERYLEVIEGNQDELREKSMGLF